MLENENIYKILHWASFESRIHLLNQLVNPELAFLWIRQQERISTKIEINVARKNSYFKKVFFVGMRRKDV